MHSSDLGEHTDAKHRAVTVIKDIKKKDHTSTGMAKWDYVLSHKKIQPDQKHCSFAVQTHLRSICETTGSDLKPNGNTSQFSFLYHANASISL